MNLTLPCPFCGCDSEKSKQEMERLNAEYELLWDAVIQFINSPGLLNTIEQIDAYNTLANCAINAKFWQSNIKVK